MWVSYRGRSKTVLSQPMGRRETLEEDPNEYGNLVTGKDKISNNGGEIDYSKHSTGTIRSQPGNELQMYQRFKYFRITRPWQINIDIYTYIHIYVCFYIFKYNGNMPCTLLCLLLVFT